MFSVIVRVEVPGEYSVEAAREQLNSFMVPAVKASPGFVAGYWLAPAEGRDGLSVLIYQDEESARTLAGKLHPRPPVTLLGVEVREVVASA